MSRPFISLGNNWYESAMWTVRVNVKYLVRRWNKLVTGLGIGYVAIGMRSWCKRCGRPVSDFIAPDKVWGQVLKIAPIPTTQTDTVLCYNCFCGLCGLIGLAQVWELSDKFWYWDGNKETRPEYREIK